MKYEGEGGGGGCQTDTPPPPPGKTTLKNPCFIRVNKQVFVGLLSFSKSLATKCVSLNNEPCMTRPTLYDLNLIKFNYYPFLISINKCNGDCNAADDLFKKICVPSKKM